MKRAILLGLALAALSGAGASALAQDAGGPVSALKGHDSNAPVDVVADRLEVQDRADRAIFSGNVRVDQGNLTLTTSRLTIAYATAGGIKIDRLDASGGVTMTSPSERASGDFAVYDTNRKLITMVGNVQLKRGGSSIAGSRLLIDLDSGRAVIEGGAAGVDRDGGRVRGRFTVPQRG